MHSGNARRAAAAVSRITKGSLRDDREQQLKPIINLFFDNFISANSFLIGTIVQWLFLCVFCAFLRQNSWCFISVPSVANFNKQSQFSFVPFIYNYFQSNGLCVFCAFSRLQKTKPIKANLGEKSSIPVFSSTIVKCDFEGFALYILIFLFKITNCFKMIFLFYSI